MRVIWFADSDSPHIQRWLEALREQSVDVELHSIVKRRPRALYLFDLCIMLYKMRSVSCDVVHAHYASSYGVIASFLPSRFKRIVSIWGSDVLVTPQNNPIYKHLVQRALWKADIRIANSRYLAKKAFELAPLDYLTVPFGIDLDKFPYTLRHFDSNENKPFVVGIAKRLHKVAGIDVLLREFSEAFTLVPSVEMQLHIVGSGPEESQLKQIAMDLGIERNVVWHGWCDTRRVAEIVEKTHLCVFPSRVEGLGVAVIESMASGAPFFAARQGGLVELLGAEEQYGSSFDLVEGSLSKKIANCVLNYESFVAKAASARRLVEDNYDIKKNAKQLISVYRDLGQGES